MVERERELSTSTKNIPSVLKYQYTGKFDLKISDKCCYRLKKEIAKEWQEENHKGIVITGIRAEEGGMRNQGGCTVFEENDLVKFHPLKVVSDSWENEFLEREREYANSIIHHTISKGRVAKVVPSIKKFSMN